MLVAWLVRQFENHGGAASHSIRILVPELSVAYVRTNDNGHLDSRRQSAAICVDFDCCDRTHVAQADPNSRPLGMSDFLNDPSGHPAPVTGVEL